MLGFGRGDKKVKNLQNQGVWGHFYENVPLLVVLGSGEGEVVGSEIKSFWS